MDHAVQLVRAYLEVNGYFTVCEHPVVEARHPADFREATDVDVLAFRFPRSPVGCLGMDPGARRSLPQASPDPLLGEAQGRADMIVGEVKEGVAVLNRGARDAGVLAAALARFGCCDPSEAEPCVRDLLRRGVADVPAGHRVRLVAFGVHRPERTRFGAHVVTLGHVLSFLQAHVARNWEALRHVRVRDPVLGHLALAEKARRAGEQGRGASARAPSREPSGARR